MAWIFNDPIYDDDLRWWFSNNPCLRSIGCFLKILVWSGLLPFTFYLILISPYIFHYYYRLIALLKLLYYFITVQIIFFFRFNHYILFNDSLQIISNKPPKLIGNISFLRSDFYPTFIYFPKWLSTNRSPCCSKTHWNAPDTLIVNQRRISFCKRSYQNQVDRTLRVAESFYHRRIVFSQRNPRSRLYSQASHLAVNETATRAKVMIVQTKKSLNRT